MELVISMGHPWLDTLMRLTLVGLFFLVWYYSFVILHNEVFAPLTKAIAAFIKKRKAKHLESETDPELSPRPGDFLVEWSASPNFTLVTRRHCHDYEHANRAMDSLLDEFGEGYIRMFIFDSEWGWYPYSEPHGRSDEAVEIQSVHPELTEIEEVDVKKNSLETIPDKEEDNGSTYILYWAPTSEFKDGEVEHLMTDDLELSAKVFGFVHEASGLKNLKYRMRLEADEENDFYRWGPVRDYIHAH